MADSTSENGEASISEASADETGASVNPESNKKRNFKKKLLLSPSADDPDINNLFVTSVDAITRERSFTCNACTRVITSPYNARRHSKVHLRDQFITCGFCMKILSGPLSFDLHAKNVHGGRKKIHVEEKSPKKSPKLPKKNRKSRAKGSKSDDESEDVAALDPDTPVTTRTSSRSTGRTGEDEAETEAGLPPEEMPEGSGNSIESDDQPVVGRSRKAEEETEAATGLPSEEMLEGAGSGMEVDAQQVVGRSRPERRSSRNTTGTRKVEDETEAATGLPSEEMPEESGIAMEAVAQPVVGRSRPDRSSSRSTRRFEDVTEASTGLPSEEMPEDSGGAIGADAQSAVGRSSRAERSSRRISNARIGDGVAEAAAGLVPDEMALNEGAGSSIASQPVSARSTRSGRNSSRKKGGTRRSEDAMPDITSEVSSADEDGTTVEADSQPVTAKSRSSSRLSSAKRAEAVAEATKDVHEAVAVPTKKAANKRKSGVEAAKGAKREDVRELGRRSFQTPKSPKRSKVTGKADGPPVLTPQKAAGEEAFDNQDSAVDSPPELIFSERRTRSSTRNQKKEEVVVAEVAKETVAAAVAVVSQEDIARLMAEVQKVKAAQEAAACGTANENPGGEGFGSASALDTQPASGRSSRPLRTSTRNANRKKSMDVAEMAKESEGATTLAEAPIEEASGGLVVPDPDSATSSRSAASSRTRRSERVVEMKKKDDRTVEKSIEKMLTDDVAEVVKKLVDDVAHIAPEEIPRAEASESVASVDSQPVSTKNPTRRSNRNAKKKKKEVAEVAKEPEDAATVENKKSNDDVVEMAMEVEEEAVVPVASENSNSQELIDDVAEAVKKLVDDVADLTPNEIPTAEASESVTSVDSQPVVPKSAKPSRRSAKKSNYSKTKTKAQKEKEAVRREKAREKRMTEAVDKVVRNLIDDVAHIVPNEIPRAEASESGTSIDSEPGGTKSRKGTRRSNRKTTKRKIEDSADNEVAMEAEDTVAPIETPLEESGSVDVPDADSVITTTTSGSDESSCKKKTEDAIEMAEAEEENDTEVSKESQEKEMSDDVDDVAENLVDAVSRTAPDEISNTEASESAMEIDAQPVIFPTSKSDGSPAKEKLSDDVAEMANGVGDDVDAVTPFEIPTAALDPDQANMEEMNPNGDTMHHDDNMVEDGAEAAERAEEAARLPSKSTQPAASSSSAESVIAVDDEQLALAVRRSSRKPEVIPCKAPKGRKNKMLGYALVEEKPKKKPVPAFSMVSSACGSQLKERRSTRIQLRKAIEESVADEEARRAKKLTSTPIYPTNNEKMREMMEAEQRKLMSRRGKSSRAYSQKRQRVVPNKQWDEEMIVPKRERISSIVEICSSVDASSSQESIEDAALAAAEFFSPLIDESATAAPCTSYHDLLDPRHRSFNVSMKREPMSSSSWMMTPALTPADMNYNDHGSSSNLNPLLSGMYGTRVHKRQPPMRAPLSALYPAPLTKILYRIIWRPEWARGARRRMGEDELQAIRQFGHMQFTLSNRMRETTSLMAKCERGLEETSIPLPPLQPLLPTPCAALVDEFCDALADALPLDWAPPPLPPFAEATLALPTRLAARGEPWLPEARYVNANMDSRERLLLATKSEDRQWWEVRTFPSFNGYSFSGHAPALPTSARSTPMCTFPSFNGTAVAGSDTKLPTWVLPATVCTFPIFAGPYPELPTKVEEDVRSLALEDAPCSAVVTGTMADKLARLNIDSTKYIYVTPKQPIFSVREMPSMLPARPRSSYINQPVPYSTPSIYNTTASSYMAPAPIRNAGGYGIAGQYQGSLVGGSSSVVSVYSNPAGDYSTPTTTATITTRTTAQRARPRKRPADLNLGTLGSLVKRRLKSSGHPSSQPLLLPVRQLKREEEPPLPADLQDLQLMELVLPPVKQERREDYDYFCSQKDEQPTSSNSHHALRSVKREVIAIEEDGTTFAVL